MAKWTKYSYSKLDFDFNNPDPVICIFCDQSFDIKYNHQSFLTHLLDIHHFLFESVEEILDLRLYVMYWQKLRNENLKDYCNVYIAKTKSQDAIPETECTFYMLWKKLDEDKELRAIIRDRKLKFVTDQKSLEYREPFSRPCIYCREIIEGHVADSFHHLTSQHGFSLGNPDNIVFGAKLLDIMEDKIKNLICLGCEKIFKSNDVLKQHMRKKFHKTLNPHNKFYDQFYIRNYLMPGKSWEEAKVAISEESDEDDGGRTQCYDSESEDIPGDNEEAKCLFCDYKDTYEPKRIQYHMKEEHDFPFDDVTQGRTFYDKVKIVNYIRFQVQDCRCPYCDVECPSKDQFSCHVRLCNHCQLTDLDKWRDDRFLHPVIEDDILLSSLIDEDQSDDEQDSRTVKNRKSQKAKKSLKTNKSKTSGSNN